MVHQDTGVADKCINYCHASENIIPTCCYGASEP